MYRPPDGATHTAFGSCNWAATAGPPSPAAPAVPLPATVETTPEARSTRRIRWLAESAMNRPAPAGSTANPWGQWRVAAPAGPPSPEYAACPVPTSVVTAPRESTRRTRWLNVSAM